MLQFSYILFNLSDLLLLYLLVLLLINQIHFILGLQGLVSYVDAFSGGQETLNMSKVVVFLESTAIRGLLVELGDLLVHLSKKPRCISRLVVLCHSLTGALLVEPEAIVLGESVELVQVLVKIDVEGAKALATHGRGRWADLFHVFMPLPWLVLWRSFADLGHLKVRLRQAIAPLGKASIRCIRKIRRVHLVGAKYHAWKDVRAGLLELAALEGLRQLLVVRVR